MQLLVPSHQDTEIHGCVLQIYVLTANFYLMTGDQSSVIYMREMRL